MRQNPTLFIQSPSDRNMFVLFMVILLSSISVNLVTPIWIFYVSSLGASIVELGYISGIPSAVTAFVNILGGSLSDKYGRRKLNVIGTLFGVFPPLLYIFAKNWVELIPWVMLSGLATGLSLPVRWSIVADSSTDRKRAMTFGWMNIAFLLGSTFAPFVGGFTADALGIRSTFVLCSVFMSSCLIFSLLLKESRKPPTHQPVIDSNRGETRQFLTLVFIILALNVIQATGIGIYIPITPKFIERQFKATYTDAGILYAIGFGLSSMVVQIPGGRLATRYSRKKIVLITIVLSAPFFGFFALSRSFLECVILMFISNVILNLSWPAYQDLTMSLTPPARRGFMNGVSATSFWIGMTIGSTISGILWENFSMFLPYYMSAVMVLLSALPFLSLKEHNRKAQP